MTAFRPAGYANEVSQRMIAPGDLVLGGESLLAGAIATVGNGTWTGAAIATGIINRTGPTGGYTDTTDTAANILAAIQGNSNAPIIEPGSTFRLIVRNTVAQALTNALGTGVIAGTGTLNIANSLVRMYLLTVLNASPVQIWNAQVTNGSAIFTLSLPPGVLAAPYPSSNSLIGAFSATPGATVSGTNVPAATTLLSVTNGPGGVIGGTLSANATGTAVVALTIGPTIQIDSIGTFGL